MRSTQQKEVSHSNKSSHSVFAQASSTISKNMSSTPMDISAPVSKAPSTLQQGVTLMKDKDVLVTIKNNMLTLAGMVQSDTSKAFDAVHANIPWKSVDVDYLKSLPVKDLTLNPGDVSSLLLWVDSAYMDKAVDVLRAWGFEFRSVLHVIAYDRPTPDKAVIAGKTDGGEEDSAGSVSESEAVTTRTTRKQAIPPGWSTEGLVTSRTRQLWYAETTCTTSESTTATRYLKDPSFIRKRLNQVSTFIYPDGEETYNTTTLSAKKKNLETWKIFPEYDVYIPSTLRNVLESIFKPTARVLSLFADGFSRQWFSWGPNVPGYFNGPLRNDSGFPLPAIILKSLSNIKMATVQKNLSIVNQYAVMMGKGLGSSEEAPIGPLVENKMNEFIDDLCHKAESGGGMRENPMSSASSARLMSANDFQAQDPVVKTQFLLTIAQVIRAIFRKNTEAADRRRRVGKRKRNTEEDGQPTAPRKYGIAAPVSISEKLAVFMGLEPGATQARTSVVKFINDYIKKNNLQNPEKKNNILLDEQLRNLLEPDENFGPVTYFNLCRLLKSHFMTIPKPVENEA